jgi:very-short-patch-repair endonuclease
MLGGALGATRAATLLEITRQMTRSRRPRRVAPLPETSRCESPLELAFLHAMRKHDDLIMFCPNLPVMNGRYRIDFADYRRLIGIEIDGHAYHSDKETFTKDRARQRDLERAGWRIVRYSGQEVHRDADACVADLRAWLNAIA